MGFRVLSLFDGMACGMLAMMAAEVSVERYDAYEIDKYAVAVSRHNFPQIVQHGDVFAADFTEYECYDFLIGGSPCTYWSIAQRSGRRETAASGAGWELFSQYVRALHEARPRAFIYENNKSMSEDIRASITGAFGFEPICINSALVSAQNRQRLYWVGVRQGDGTYRRASIDQPEDRGTLLRDALDSTTASHADPVALQYQPHGRSANAEGKYDRRYEAKTDGKSPALTSAQSRRIVAEPIRIGTMPSTDGRQNGGQAMRVYDPDGKGVALKANAGGGGAKTGLYAMQEEAENGQHVYEVKGGMIEVDGKTYPIKLRDGRYVIRKLTVTECMRLQTVPEWYDFSCVSNTQAYKMLGNGWTVEVIAHLIRGLMTYLEKY